MIRRKCLGFTLIELVTIVLIVGVHLAILFPILEKSREEGRKSTCKDNIRQCAIALQVYLNDYDSSLPSSVCAASVRGQAPTEAEVTHYLTGLEPLPPKPGAVRKTWAQVIYEYLANPDCLSCPSDTPRSRLSYWYKYAADVAWRSPSISARKESDYNYADRQVTFYEHAGWHSGDAAGIKNGVTINVAFLDTHITTVTVKNGPTDHPSAADEASGVSGCRLGAPMYYNYDATTNTAHTGVANWTDPRRYCDVF